MENNYQSQSVNKGDQLLPIGSVLTIEGIEQLIMIYGRKQQQVDNEEKVWDYVGCPYPQGHLSTDTNIFFQHTNIAKVVFKGLETEGEIAFREQLNTAFKVEDAKV